MSSTPELHVEGIDRLDESWVSDHPAYRVTFWSLPRGTDGASQLVPLAFNAEHWRISGARDALEVLAWARADGRMFELFAESEDADAAGGFTRTVLRLTGYNPALGPSHNPRDFLSTAGEAEAVESLLKQSEGGAPTPRPPS
jgi:hypothetical protein